jgi:hypothetical protein
MEKVPNLRDNGERKKTMNMSLTRGSNTPDGTGTFGQMTSDDGSFSCVTLERLFDGALKIPTGSWQCQICEFLLKINKKP